MPDDLSYLMKELKVPKDPLANMRWRVGLREQAISDKGLQKALRDACYQDVLWFFNFALFLKEPRARIKELAFTTWRHQDSVIVEMDNAISTAEETGTPLDVLVPKSREQGGTFIACGIILRRWLRDNGFSAGIVTRNEKDVDSKTNPGALLYKITYMLKMLPPWLRPKGFDFDTHRSFTEHVLSNPERGSIISGSAAVADLFRGDRLTVLFFDEAGSQEWITGGKDYAAAASTAHVANARLFISTFGGDSGMFYQACEKPGNAKVLKLDWRENPVHGHLSFVIREGIPFARNEGEHEEVKEYFRRHKTVIDSLIRQGFIKDGKPISPWYIGHCLRPGATPRSIAREIDMDARGAVGKVFDSDVLDRMLKENCRPCVWQGKLVYDPETMRPTGLIRQEGGPLKLWFTPGLDNSPPIAKYALGFDIGTGRNTEHTSNSAIYGANAGTGEQVLVYLDKSITAIKFARLGVAFARWMYDAYMNWDAVGPLGGAFRHEVLEEVGYHNVFYRPTSDELFLDGPSKKAGSFIGNDEVKGNLFETMSMAMADDKFIPRSEEFVAECNEYEWLNGKIIHRPSRDKKEDGKAHGDLVIAGGCCLIAIRDRPVSAIDTGGEYSDNPPYGSFAWRMREAREAERKRQDVTGFEGEFTLGNLLGASQSEFPEWGRGIGFSAE